MFRNTTLSEKVMVLGIDGLDPRYTARMVKEGKMPAFTLQQEEKKEYGLCTQQRTSDAPQNVS